MLYVARTFLLNIRYGDSSACFFIKDKKNYFLKLQAESVNQAAYPMQKQVNHLLFTSA